jgi:V/A-type H+-transporting ATPase subunit F
MGSRRIPSGKGCVKRMADKQLRLGAVGEKDVILAFRAIGAIAYPATTADEVAAALHRLSREAVPVVFITEAAARLAPEALSKYEQSLDIAIIPVPGVRGSDGLGMQRVRDNVIKAIGADILINQDRNEE